MIQIIKDSASIILVLAFLAVAINISGFASSTGDSRILLMALALVAGVFVVFDAGLLLVITLLGGLVVAGVAQLYVPRLELVRWAFTGSAMVLLLHILVEAIKTNSLNFKVNSTVIFWVAMFISTLVFSALFHRVDLATASVSLKGYLQVWGALFALALLPWSEDQIKKLPLFLLAVAIIQVPFVLHQYFVLVPMRMGINDVEGLVPIDIVSGTFGGQINHGGANAALTVLCFIVASGILSLWKNQVISTKIFIFLITLVAFPAFINSTKISAFYLMVVLLFTYYEQIYLNPIRFLMKVIFTLALCVVLAFSVISTLPESAQVESLTDLYEQTYNYNLGQDNIRDNRLSRSGTINAWLDPVFPHRFRDIIVGYGIGSSRIINSVGGERISTTINLERPTGVTAIAAILWETGIMGMLVVTMLFASAFSAATRLKRLYKQDLFNHSIFTALQSSIVILFISLGHKSFFTFHIGYQTLFIVLFGYIAYWERRAAIDLSSG